MSNEVTEGPSDVKIGAASRALVVEDVCLNFGGLRALDHVSLRVAPGTLHAVIGPNGAGKSSLFNVLSGLNRARGSIRFGSEELIGRSGHRIAALGIARTFQNLVLPEGLTVEECLLLGRHHVIRTSRGLPVTLTRRAEVCHRKRIDEIADRVGVADFLTRQARSLSYGDQKRVELGRALAAEPALLLLDEPVAGMNPRESHEVGDLIASLRDDFSVSIVLVEHDMTVVMAIADRVTVLEFGRVIADGTAKDVVADPAVLRSYLGPSSISAAGNDHDPAAAPR